MFGYDSNFELADTGVYIYYRLWLHTSNHALVVTKLDDILVWIHDPLRLEGPTKIPTVEFIELWTEAAALEFIIDEMQ